MNYFLEKFADAFQENPVLTPVFIILTTLLIIVVYDYFHMKHNQVNRQVSSRIGKLQEERKKIIDFDEIAQKLFSRFEDQISLDLQKANVLFTVQEYFNFMMFGMLAGAFIGLVIFPVGDLWRGIFAWLPTPLTTEIFGRIFEAGLLTYAGFYFPKLWLKYLSFKRNRMMEEQLMDALLNIADALKSGHVIQEAIRIVGDEMPYPIGPEFERAAREMDVGKTLNEALLDMKKRITFADFKMAVNAIEIQFEVGGKLEPLLRNMVRIIQERYELRMEIKKTIASSKTTGYVLLAAPLVFLLLFSSINKDTYLQMLHSIIGIGMLAVAFVCYAIAAAIIFYIIRDVSKDI